LAGDKWDKDLFDKNAVDGKVTKSMFAAEATKIGYLPAVAVAPPQIVQLAAGAGMQVASSLKRVYLGEDMRRHESTRSATTKLMH
jgi:hypothetical protein